MCHIIKPFTSDVRAWFKEPGSIPAVACLPTLTVTRHWRHGVRYMHPSWLGTVPRMPVGDAFILCLSHSARQGTRCIFTISIRNLWTFLMRRLLSRFITEMLMKSVRTWMPQFQFWLAKKKKKITPDSIILSETKKRRSCVLTPFLSTT